MKKSMIAVSILAVLSAPVFAENQDSSWVFRGTVAYVSPNDDSGPVLGNDGLTVDSGLGLGLSLTYMLDQNWGVEVLAATPFTHDLTGTGDLAGLDIGVSTSF